VLQCVAVCCSVLQCRNHGTLTHMSKVSMLLVMCVAVCCSVLQCVALLCCGVLQYVAVWCSTEMMAHTYTWARWDYHSLQHTATHCNTLQHTATHCNTAVRLSFTYACCSVLQCVAVCCGVLQCVEHEIGVFLHQISTDGHRVNSYSISIYTPIYIHTYM